MKYLTSIQPLTVTLPVPIKSGSLSKGVGRLSQMVRQAHHDSYKGIVGMILLLLLCMSAKAQAPFTGGSGDGYAMAELVITAVGVDETASDKGFHIYPNVLSSGQTLTIQHDYEELLLLEFVNTQTQVIKTVTIDQQLYQLPLHAIPPGVYYLVINSKAIGRKIIVL